MIPTCSFLPARDLPTRHVLVALPTLRARSIVCREGSLRAQSAASLLLNKPMCRGETRQPYHQQQLRTALALLLQRLLLRAFRAQRPLEQQRQCRGQQPPLQEPRRLPRRLPRPRPPGLQEPLPFRKKARRTRADTHTPDEGAMPGSRPRAADSRSADSRSAENTAEALLAWRMGQEIDQRRSYRPLAFRFDKRK